MYDFMQCWICIVNHSIVLKNKCCWRTGQWNWISCWPGSSQWRNKYLYTNKIVLLFTHVFIRHYWSDYYTKCIFKKRAGGLILTCNNFLKITSCYNEKSRGIWINPHSFRNFIIFTNMSVSSIHGSMWYTILNWACDIVCLTLPPRSA